MTALVLTTRALDQKPVVLERFGFTVERVADIGRRVVRDGFRGRVAAIDHTA